MTPTTSVRARLMLTLGILSSLTLAAGGIGWLGLARTERTLEAMQAETLADVRRVMTLAERTATLAALSPSIAEIGDPAALDRMRDDIRGRLEEFMELAVALPPLADPVVAPTLEPSIVRLADRLDGIVRNLVDVTGEAIASRARLAAARARVAAAERRLLVEGATAAAEWRALAALQAGLAAADIPTAEAARDRFAAAAPALGPLGDVFEARILEVSVLNRTRFHLAAIGVASAAMTGLLKTYALAVERSGRNRAEAAAEVLDTGKSLVLGVGAVALIAALGFANAFMRDVVEKLQGAAAAMRRLAAGDQTAQAPGLSRADEIGDLARSFAVFKAQAAEREVMERQLRQAQKMEAIGQLSGGIAHDFNNLLAAVTSNVQLIHDTAEPDSPTRMRALRALDAVDHGAAMVQRLLAFGRRQMLAPEPTEVDGLIAGLVELLSASVGAGIALDHRPAAAAGPAWAMVDPGQFENALINLVFNARDAMAGRGRIILATGRALDGMVRIEVIDTGPGMAPEVLARIFEPFFTTKPAGAGSGLGLSMVYGFVRQSGGRITVDSAPGQGARFVVDLPAAEAPAVSAEAEPAAAVPDRGRSIVLVEDDPAVRAATADVLRSLGHRVAAFATAEAALERLPALRPDLVLTDYALGSGMDGLDLAARASAADPPIAVVIMSGYAREMPADLPVLVKPFRREDLQAAIDAAA